MISFVRVYRRLLYERPFITNVLTTATFMTGGDFASQNLIQDKDHIDLKQTARFTIAGLIFVGPVARGCIVMIDKIFGPTSSNVVLVKKVLFDQVINAPLFLAGNITTLTLLKTQSFECVREELRRSYTNLLKTNYSFWPMVQAINFYFIPITFRVLFGSVCAFVYNMAFSYILHSESPSKES